MMEFCSRMAMVLGIGLASGVGVGCGSTASPVPPGVSGSPAGQEETSARAGASEIADPLVQLARVEGSTFIEILEVDAHDDGRLFYCTAVRGLQIVDARDPMRPRPVAELAGSLWHPKFARCQHLDLDRARDDGLLYITNHGDMIQRTPFVTAFDLSHDPPREVTTFTKADHTFEGIAARDGKVYVAMHNRGMMVLEQIGDELVERATLGGLRGAWGIDVAGSHGYIAETAGSLAIVDVADPRRPTLAGRLALEGSGQAVTVQGRTAFVAMGIGGVAIVDVSNPSAPGLLATIDTDSAALQVALAGHHAFVANWNDARVYDVTNPRSPRLIAIERIATEGPFSRVLGIAARGDTAFIGEWTGMYTYKLHPERRAPDLQPGELVIELGPVPVGQSRSETLTIENPGNATLQISKLDITGQGMSVQPSSLEVPPGRSSVVQVTYDSPPGPGPVPLEATLTLHSNDPDESVQTIAVRANTGLLTMGKPAPEVEVALFGGGDWKLSEQRGKVVLLAYFATF